MYCVYAIYDTTSKECYVGKTNNFKRRKREHKSNAFNKNSNEYNKKFYQRIREIGWQCFEGKIIEDDLSKEQAKEKEEYWIKKIGTLNVSDGGYSDDYPEEKIDDIKKDILSGVPYSEISKKYNTTIGFISSLNNGKLHSKEGEIYPLVLKGCVDKSWCNPMIELLCTTKKPFRVIAEETGHSEAKVKKFNYGRQNRIHWLKYPIRKNAEENLKQLNLHR